MGGEDSFINGWVAQSNAGHTMTKTIMFSPTIIAATGKYWQGYSVSIT